jgi:hypothetical protein
MDESIDHSGIDGSDESDDDKPGQSSSEREAAPKAAKARCSDANAALLGTATAALRLAASDAPRNDELSGEEKGRQKHMQEKDACDAWMEGISCVSETDIQ